MPGTLFIIKQKKSESKMTKTDEVAKELMPTPNYMFLQSLLLVLHYGFDKNLPFWVMWFPSILYGSVLIVALCILLAALVISK
jgi:hypothetical protein